MRIVVALGGNALGVTLPEQMLAVQNTARAIAELVIEGHQVILSHGNGPQVGMLQTAMQEYAAKRELPAAPLSVCVAMSQGYIGYDVQNALREELIRRGQPTAVSTVLTQVRVDPADPAFAAPTKPIGVFYTKEQADELVARKGYVMREDAGRGWRRVVASPKPQEIIELDTVHALLDAGQIVIAAGGGGIPVIAQGDHLKGVAAVIDKDYAAALMADALGADCFLILTAVDCVWLHYGTPQAEPLSRATCAEALRYDAQGQFAEGSMRPKVLAAIAFAGKRPGRRAIITALDRAIDGVRGAAGTQIEADA